MVEIILGTPKLDAFLLYFEGNGNNKLNKLKKLSNIRYTATVARNLFLFSIFRFPHWHIFATNYNRKYKLSLSNNIQSSSIKYDFVCDIGCGLGEVIRVISNKIDGNPRLYGVDFDHRVLKASRLLNRKITYINLDIMKKGNFEILFKKLDSGISRNGAIIMVNWPSTDEIYDFIYSLNQFPWKEMIEISLYFDIRTEATENLDKYAYIPSRNILATHQILEIQTGDFERNLGLFKFRRS